MWIVTPCWKIKVCDSIGRVMHPTVDFDKIWGISDSTIREDILEALNSDTIDWGFKSGYIYDSDILSLIETETFFFVKIKQCETEIGFHKDRYFEEV